MMSLAELNNGEMIPKDNKYLKDIIEALENVSPSYVVNSNTPGHLAERIFAYEFYHQYRLLMENCNEYEGCILCGEQSKLYDDKNLGKTTETKKEQQSPDIVLAGNVENIDPATQYWVAEIKMAGNASWEEDIKKLVKYAKNQLSFKHLFFIYVCNGEEQKMKIIQKLDKRAFTEDEQSIFILVCTKYGTQERLKAKPYSYTKNKQEIK